MLRNETTISMHQSPHLGDNRCSASTSIDYCLWDPIFITVSTTIPSFVLQAYWAQWIKFISSPFLYEPLKYYPPIQVVSFFRTVRTELRPHVTRFTSVWISLISSSFHYTRSKRLVISPLCSFLQLPVSAHLLESMQYLQSPGVKHPQPKDKVKFVFNIKNLSFQLHNDQRNAQVFNSFIYLLLPYMFRAFL
jgi:hypothetical protein